MTDLDATRRRDVDVAPPRGSAEIIVPGARLETVFEGLCVGEGVASAPDGRIYVSDITVTFAFERQAGHVWCHDPATGATEVFLSPSGMANGRAFDHLGRMYQCEGADFGGRRITRIDMRTRKAEILTGLYDGRPYNSPNDLCLDERGRVYFTDPRYLGHEPIEQPCMGVYRIDIDGSVQRIVTSAEKPNGVGVTPDQSTLVIADLNDGAWDRQKIDHERSPFGRMAVLAYDLDADGNASPSPRETLVDFGDKEGIDGFVFDEDGNIYGAVRSDGRWGIGVYDPSGAELGFVPTPLLPTNCGFGRGEDAMTLYVGGAGPQLFRIPMRRRGYHPDEHYRGAPATA